MHFKNHHPVEICVQATSLDNTSEYIKEGKILQDSLLQGKKLAKH